MGNPIDIRTPHDAMAAQASSHSTVYIMVNRPAAEIAIASAAWDAEIAIASRNTMNRVTTARSDTPRWLAEKVVPDGLRRSALNIRSHFDAVRLRVRLCLAFVVLSTCSFRGFVTKREIVSNRLSLVFNFPCIIVCLYLFCDLLSGTFRRVLNSYLTYVLNL